MSHFSCLKCGASPISGTDLCHAHSEPKKEIKPFYEHAGIIIYHGDCREIISQIPKVDLVLTDPPYGIGESNERALSRGKLANPTDYGQRKKLMQLI